MGIMGTSFEPPANGKSIGQMTVNDDRRVDRSVQEGDPPSKRGAKTHLYKDLLEKGSFDPVKCFPLVEGK